MALTGIKILHAAAFLDPIPGIIQQMHWEQIAANTINLNWTTKIFCPSGYHLPRQLVQYSLKQHKDRQATKRKTGSWLALRKEFYSWLLDTQQSYDAIILRYSPHDPFLHRFMTHVDRPVFFVHHTKETDELAASNKLIGRVRSWIESKTGPIVLRKAHGLIGVTKEIADYQHKRSKLTDRPKPLIYPNGIIYPANLAADKRAQQPNLLFVASQFYPWHGLDLLLHETQKSSANFKLHIVGHVPAQLEASYTGDNRIIYHGHTTPQKIRDLAGYCDIGLSSFALYRKGMKAACTLKVREYLSWGLPVYASYEDVFPDDFIYYRNDVCSLEKILEYANKYKTIHRSIISEAARPFIDKQVLLNSLHSSITRSLHASTNKHQ